VAGHFLRDENHVAAAFGALAGIFLPAAGLNELVEIRGTD
jgi:hypothetical protein